MARRIFIYPSLFPTPTAGSGEVLAPYRKLTDGQGRSVSTIRVSCAQCGFPGADKSKHDHGGGTLDGSGGLGVITQQGTGADGDQAYNSGGGCPLCGSKNYTGRRRIDELMQAPISDVIR